MTKQNKSNHRCPHCGQKLKPEQRAVRMSTTLVSALMKVYKWCVENGVHEFKMNKLRHLLSHNEYANMNNWPMFGGLVYKNDNIYGLNFDRIEEFKEGKRLVPEKIWKSNVGGENVIEKYISIRQVPNVKKLLDDDGKFKIEYRTGKNYITITK